MRLIDNDHNLGFIRSVICRCCFTGGASRYPSPQLRHCCFSGGHLRNETGGLSRSYGRTEPALQQRHHLLAAAPARIWECEPEEAYANFRSLAQYLPDFHFLPTAVGFCLYIKARELLRQARFAEAESNLRGACMQAGLRRRSATAVRSPEGTPRPWRIDDRGDPAREILNESNCRRLHRPRAGERTPASLPGR